CAFSPDGRFIVAGGADNTIRVWKFISTDKPRINPMVQARFAHEGPVVRLAFTADGSRLVTLGEDRTIKAWETSGYTELQLWTDQPDVAAALAIAGDGSSFQVGRMNGSLAHYTLPAARPHSAAAQAASTAEEATIIREGAGVGRATEHEPNNTP